MHSESLKCQICARAGDGVRMAGLDITVFVCVSIRADALRCCKNEYDTRRLSSTLRICRKARCVRMAAAEEAFHRWQCGPREPGAAQIRQNTRRRITAGFHAALSLSSEELRDSDPAQVGAARRWLCNPPEAGAALSRDSTRLRFKFCHGVMPWERWHPSLSRAEASTPQILLPAPMEQLRPRRKTFRRNDVRATACPEER